MSGGTKLDNLDIDENKLANLIIREIILNEDNITQENNRENGDNKNNKKII